MYPGRLGAGVVIAVVTLVGCGGNGGGSTVALSKADYIAKGDAICAQKRRQRGQLVTEVQNAIASGVNSASDQILDTLLSTVSAEATDIRHFADAVDSLDASQIRSFGEAADSDAAKAVAIAQGYGFKVCGQG
jgi:uncharacterized membrane protein YqiK